MTFLDYLLEKKILDKKQVKQIIQESQKSSEDIEEIILKKQRVGEDSLFKAKSDFLNIPLKVVLPEEIKPDVLSIIPKEAVDFYKIVPLEVDRKTGVLEVGMVNPDDTQGQQALQFLGRQHKLKPRIFLITPTLFHKALEKYRAPAKEVEKAVEALEETIKIEGLEGQKVKKQEFERLVEEAPVIKMVAVIVRQAVEGGASDIHIEPTKNGSRIRYRFDGVLYSSLTLPAQIHPAVVARVKILSGLKIDETRIPQDGRFSTMIGNKRIDFRVSTFPTTSGEKIAIRVLNPAQGLKSMKELGFHKEQLRLTQLAIKKPFGMILVTGPTGSGKSTTLYSILKILNQEGVNIVTLEDPVEYYMEGINQSQVKPDIDYTFARGLRQILRQDPDIIMVGEIRDAETASLAVHAALTGHLVLSTLHTNNAPGVVPRLIDMGIKPFLIPPSLNLIISQRLLRKLCPYCKKKTEAKGAVKKYLIGKIKRFPAKFRKEVNLSGPLYIFQPKGCRKCNKKAYSGRQGVFEVLEMTDELAEIINKDPSQHQVTRQARVQGMMTMEEDGILKVLEGITSVEEVMKLSEGIE